MILAYNKIKFMKGWVFKTLPALEEVVLDHNKCINRKFGSNEIQELPKILNQTCGIDKSETQITCEKIYPRSNEKINRVHPIVCDMNTYSVIKDIGHTFSDPLSDTLLDMVFEDNRNIEFLPDSPHQIFPALRKIFAARCAIREIARRNFENLRELFDIQLEDNQIYVVPSDTFKDQVRLLFLDLSK